MKTLSKRPLRLTVVLALLGVGAAPGIVAQPESQLVNLSARGQVGTGAGGEDALIGGFVISGNASRQVMVRAVGPALDSFGVAGRIGAVKLALYSGGREVAASTGAASAAEAAAFAAKVGAFPLPANGLNAALVSVLAPGAYTAVVSSADGTKGIALLEVYELPASSSALLTAVNQQRIQQLVDAALRSYDIPGIMYSVKFPGEAPWSQARGVRNKATGQALAADDYFRIGSASKTFTGMAALKAVDESRLKLEATLDRLLPADVLSSYPRNRITVRMLLNHTSGINSYTSFIEQWFMPYIANRTRVWSDAELVQMVNAKFADPQLGQVASPGAVWFYSNTNTVLLGMILERVYNQPLRQIIAQQFLAPLGLAKTIYPAPGESVMPEPYARGYMNWANYVDEPSLPSTDLDVSVYDPSGVGAAGAMVSTTGDLARWIEAVANGAAGSGALRRGHLDWKHYVAFGDYAGVAGRAAASYGLALAHEPDSTNSADYWIVGHRGQISGYDTAMMYLPEPQAAIVVACTRSLKHQAGFPTNAATVALDAIVGILFPKLVAEHKTGLASDRDRSPARAAGRPAYRLPLSEY